MSLTANFSARSNRNANSHQIGEIKIFHQLDVHHVSKVGIKRFWAQQTENSNSHEESNVFGSQDARRNDSKMSSNSQLSSLESARRKLFMNSTYIMSRK